MVTSKPRWLDADLHVLEQSEVFEKYLDAQYRSRVHLKRLVPKDDQPDPPSILGWDTYIDGRPIPAWLAGYDREVRAARATESYRKRFQPGAGTNPKQYVKDLMTDGMAGGAIYPTLFLWSTWFPHMDSAFAAALARAYNDYIHDFCSVDRKRLFPVIVISLHDPREAIREVERNAKRNFVGVFVRPNPLNGKTLGHPDYFPLYEVMQDLDMPLGIHEGTLAYQPTLGVDRVTTQAGIHIIAHPFEQMAAMLSLYEGGVFERFPRLQTLFLEAGVGWVPWWLHRIDEERKQYRPGSKGELMSTVFARQCFASAEAADENLHRVVEWIGADRLLMSSDYPHDEATFPKTTELFEAQNISPEARELIGRTNPLKAYPRIAKELAQ